MAWVTKVALSALADVSAAALVSQPTQTRAAVDARVGTVATPIISDIVANDDAVYQAAVQAVEDAAQAGELSFFKGTLATSVDLDTLLTPGVYGYWGSSPNAPGGVSGMLLVSKVATNTQQQAFEFAGNRRWRRNISPAGVAGAWVQADGSQYSFGRGFLGTSGDLNTALQPGAYGYWSSSLNRPSDVSGTVTVTEVNASGTVIQEASEYGGGVGLFRRFRAASGAWSEWKNLLAGGDHVESSSSAGFRTIPLALTVGQGPTNKFTASAGAVRMPVKFAGRVHRWRLHLRNVDPRTGTVGAATVTVPNVYFGPSTGGAAFTATRVGGGLSSSGDDMVTPWISTPINADADYVIAYSWSATEPTQRLVGGGWVSASQSDATGAGGGLSASVSMPLDAWIEAEVAPTVPVVAAFGDSLSSGVGATVPVYESWLSIYCREIGAFPAHYTHSGDAMWTWEDGNAYKWQRWAHLSRPDACVHAMGSNDIFATTPPALGELQRRHGVVTNLITERLTPNVYGTRIMPRTSQTGATEDLRRSYNVWLAGLPNGIRDLFDFVTPISNDDETVIPEYTTDGTHLTTAGYELLAGAVTPHVVPTGA